MQPSKDPLHGITLEALLNALVAKYGWAELAKRININCFKSDPSIKSSSNFYVERRGRVKRLKTFISTLSAIQPPPRRRCRRKARGRTGRIKKRVGRRREALQHRLATERPWRFAGDALKGPTEGG